MNCRDLNKTTRYQYDHLAWPFNTLRQRQNGCYFPHYIFKCIFMNENVRISLKISLNFVPKFRINNIPALVKIMAWRLTRWQAIIWINYEFADACMHHSASVSYGELRWQFSWHTPLMPCHLLLSFSILTPEQRMIITNMIVSKSFGFQPAFANL